MLVVFCYFWVGCVPMVMFSSMGSVCGVPMGWVVLMGWVVVETLY